MGTGDLGVGQRVSEVALQDQDEGTHRRGMEAHGYNSSHSAVTDSKALILAMCLSFPICSKGMWWTGPHVAMSAAWMAEAHLGHLWAVWGRLR